MFAAKTRLERTMRIFSLLVVSIGAVSLALSIAGAYAFNQLVETRLQHYLGLVSSFDMQQIDSLLEDIYEMGTTIDEFDLSIFHDVSNVLEDVVIPQLGDAAIFAEELDGNLTRMSASFKNQTEYFRTWTFLGFHPEEMDRIADAFEEVSNALEESHGTFILIRERLELTQAELGTFQSKIESTSTELHKRRSEMSSQIKAFAKTIWNMRETIRSTRDSVVSDLRFLATNIKIAYVIFFWMSGQGVALIMLGVITDYLIKRR